jgi:DNA-binding GntR family transcriptional regulator
MATGVRRLGEARAEDLIELRSLVELRALRRLVDRGIRDQELAVMRELANATMRSAFSGDLFGYLQADMNFHLRLLELTGDRALLELARPLLAPSPRPVPCAEACCPVAAAGARDHSRLVTMLTDDMMSAADDLLRQHVCRLLACRCALAGPLIRIHSLPGNRQWPIA